MKSLLSDRYDARSVVVEDCSSAKLSAVNTVDVENLTKLAKKICIHCMTPCLIVNILMGAISAKRYTRGSNVSGQSLRYAPSISR